MINDKQKNILNKFCSMVKDFQNYCEKHLGQKLGSVVAIVVVTTLAFAAFMILQSIIMGIPVQFWLAAIFLVLLLK